MTSHIQWSVIHLQYLFNRMGGNAMEKLLGGHKCWLLYYLLFHGSSTGRRGMRGCSQSIQFPFLAPSSSHFFCASPFSGSPSHNPHLQLGHSTGWNFLQEISSCSGIGSCSHLTAAKTLPLKPSTSGKENLGKYSVTESYNLLCSLTKHLPWN